MQVQQDNGQSHFASRSKYYRRSASKENMRAGIGSGRYIGDGALNSDPTSSSRDTRNSTIFALHSSRQIQ